MDRALTARSYTWPVLALTVLALALRLFRLDFQSAWVDEAFTIHAATRPWSGMIDMLVGDFNHPPLHTILIRGWLDLFGVGIWQARLLSVLAGAAAVPALFWLGRLLFDRRTALLAAALLTVSQLAIVYSQEARAYELLLLVTILTSAFFLRADRSGRRADFAVFVVLGTLAMYLHYYAAFFLLACWCFTWFAKPASAIPPRWWLLAAGAGTLFYLPWLTSGVIGSVIDNPAGATVANATAKLATPIYALNWFNSGKIAGVRSEAPLWAFAIGLIVFTIPALVAVWSSRRAAATNPTVRALRFLVFSLALPILVVWLVGFLQVVYDVRHVAHVAGAYYLLVAFGIFTIRPKALRAIALIAALAWPLTAFRATFMEPYKENVRDGLHAFASQYAAGDCVVYGAGDGRSFLFLYWSVYYPDRPMPASSTVDDLATTSTCSRAWLLWDQSPWKTGPNTVDTAQSRIAPRYIPAGAWRFSGVDVRLYAKRPQ